MKRIRFAPHALLAIVPEAFGVDFDVTDPTARDFETVDGAAVVTIEGPLVQKGGYWWDDYESIRRRVEAACASSLPAVILKIDSPGGEVDGLFECVAAIRSAAAANGKRLIAYADGLAASAAYGLACACDEIYLPSTARVGSIGVLWPLVDVTEMDRQYGVRYAFVTSGARKVDGNPHVALTKEAIAAFQTQANELAAIFFDVVSKARGLSVEDVAGLEAGMFVGAAAVAAKLADEVATFDEVLDMVSGAAAGSKETTTMKVTLATLLAVLGIASDVSDAEAASAVRDMKAAGEGGRNMLEALGATSVNDAMGIIGGLKQKAASYDAAQAKLAELERDRERSEFMAEFDRAVAEGKINDGNRATCLEICQAAANGEGGNIVTLRALVKTLPAVQRTVSRAEAPRTEAGSSSPASVSDEALRVMGITRDEHESHLKRRAELRAVQGGK